MHCGQVRFLAKEAELGFLGGTFAKCPRHFRGLKPEMKRILQQGARPYLTGACSQPWAPPRRRLRSANIEVSSSVPAAAAPGR